MVVSKPILVFSLSLDQAEQFYGKQNFQSSSFNKAFGRTEFIIFFFKEKEQLDETSPFEKRMRFIYAPTFILDQLLYVCGHARLQYVSF